MKNSDKISRITILDMTVKAEFAVFLLFHLLLNSKTQNVAHIKICNHHMTFPI